MFFGGFFKLFVKYGLLKIINKPCPFFVVILVE